MTDFNWTATFGEVKTAAQWTDLGDNDRFFNDFITGASGHAAWTAFTPTWTNLTVGSGTNTGYYIKYGTSVWFWTYLLFSSTTVGTDPYFTLPVTASSNYTANGNFIGNVHLQDTGTATYIGLVRYRSTTTATPFSQVASGTYLTLGGITSTTPFTWANSDYIGMTGFYQAAS